MRIIAIANQKSGCGKTTTAINLSASLAKRNRTVLLIDMDPQGHSTLGYNVRLEEIGLSLYHVLKEGISLDNIVLNTGVDNVRLAPSNIILSTIEQDIAGVPEKEKRLHHAIAMSKRNYDYILIDCPPNLGLLSINALRAAGEVKSYFKGVIFSTPIRMCTKLRESVSFGCPVSEYETNSIGHWDYSAVADEVLLQEDPSMEARPIAVLSSSINKVPETGIESGYTDSGFIFIYKNPKATEVKIAGDFNNWVPDKGVNTVRHEDGTWKKIIKISPGAYQYKFYIDGEWMEDPGNPNIVDNKMGSYNSLIVID